MLKGENNEYARTSRKFRGIKSKRGSIVCAVVWCPVSRNIRFEKFVPAHASAVAGWTQTVHESSMWSGRAEHPFREETVLSWRQDPDSQAHILSVSGTAAAYGELWLDSGNREAEVARIIVSPAARGQGLGVHLVHHLTALAEEAGYPGIYMRVPPGNSAALRCYTKAGFRPVDEESAASWNRSQPVEYVWLRHEPAHAATLAVTL
ncbi:GNAT family N-acetyltransferase [Streptomyces sp. NPDC004787]|uniref:GNAT family N-acetyltransferase n=1 Tax=Streptomyces sp. NPDC004787 TaxID=3154291 RepID=UPI0033AC26B5